MSTGSEQQGVQREGQRHSAVFMTTIMRNFLMNPVPEILTLILSDFTLEQLIAFRCSCKRFNDFVLLHESVIVQGVLKKVACGTTATTLYHSLLPPSSRTFKDLVDISRRCWIARQITHFLAQCRTISNSCLYYNRHRLHERQSFDPARFANSAYPYVLALIQFFEEYRCRLASLVVDPDWIQTYSGQVEELLLAKYNEETVNRLCALYHILLDLLRFSIPEERHRSMTALLGITRVNYPSSVLDDAEHLDLFTFGGLEVFREVVRRDHQGSEITLAHFSRVTPIRLPVFYDGRSHSAFLPLPRSILPPVNNVTATTICTLLPNAAAFLTNGYSTKCLDEERARFLMYLRFNEEEQEQEPTLLR